MRKFTKGLLIVLSLIIMAASGYLFANLMMNSTDKSPTKADGKSKGTEIEVAEHYTFQKLYVSETEGASFSLSVSSSTEDSFSGVLHILYVEDLFKTISFVEHKWKVYGTLKDVNSWDIRISLDNYTDVVVTGELKENQLILSEIPRFEKKNLTFNQYSDFDYESMKRKLTDLEAEKKIRTKTNVFMSTPLTVLETTLEETLKAYPLNSDGSVEQKGLTRIRIHEEFLAELTNRIEKNFAKTETILADIEREIKTTPPDKKSYLEDEGQFLFLQLNEITAETEKLSKLYNNLVAFYTYPDSEKASLYGSDDATKSSIEKLLLTYSFNKHKKYDETIGLLKRKADNLYNKFQESISE